MPRRYGVEFEPFSWAPKWQQFVMMLLSPLMWTLSALWGGGAGVVAYLLTSRPAVGWAVGILVTVGFVVWFAWTVWEKPTPKD